MYILLLKYCNIRYVFFILCGNKDYYYYYYYYNTTLNVINFATIFDFLYVRSLWELKACALIQWPTG